MTKSLQIHPRKAGGYGEHSPGKLARTAGLRQRRIPTKVPASDTRADDAPVSKSVTRPRTSAPPMKKETPPVEASPFKSATEELDALRKTFRVACRHYAERVDMEIIRLRERVAAAGEAYRERQGQGGGRGAGPCLAEKRRTPISNSRSARHADRAADAGGQTGGRAAAGFEEDRGRRG